MTKTIVWTIFFIALAFLLTKNYDVKKQKSTNLLTNFWTVSAANQKLLKNKDINAC